MPDDHQSPSSLVEAMYDVISGPADQERDWARFRALFQPGARFLIYPSPGLPAVAGGEGGDQHGEWDVEGFIEAAGEEYRKAGFWEKEIASVAESFGTIAHVFSTYETRVESPDSDPVVRGINSVQCIRVEEEWRITNLVFDMETPVNPIPLEYLPAPGA